MAAPTTNHRRGLMAETSVVQKLERENWRILARRLRTQAGEIDIVAERDGLLVIAEVKSRADLSLAAEALQPRQQKRLMLAAESPSPSMDGATKPSASTYFFWIVRARCAISRTHS